MVLMLDTSRTASTALSMVYPDVSIETAIATPPPYSICIHNNNSQKFSNSFIVVLCKNTHKFRVQVMKTRLYRKSHYFVHNFFFFQFTGLCIASYSSLSLSLSYSSHRKLKKKTDRYINEVFGQLAIRLKKRVLYNTVAATQIVLLLNLDVA